MKVRSCFLLSPFILLLDFLIGSDFLTSFSSDFDFSLSLIMIKIEIKRY